MYGVLHILGEPLTSDSLWPVLVFLAALVGMAGLRTMASRIAEWRRGESRRIVRGWSSGRGFR